MLGWDDFPLIINHLTDDSVTVLQFVDVYCGSSFIALV